MLDVRRMRTPVRDRESLVVFAAVLACNLVMVWLVVVRFGIFVTDAMARTRSAWQVFFSSEAKLANIGFVWAPLPTVLQLPLVLLPPFRWNGLSGNLLTALMGAGTAVALHLLARGLGWPRWTRYLLLGAFVLNPVMLYYAANAMSEMTLIFFVVVTMLLYVRWYRTRRWLLLVGMGASTSLACLARYDALVFGGCLAVLVFIHVLSEPGRRLLFAEGAVLAYATPVVYGLGLWMIANWLIMGDPLHFVRSTYSNVGQVGYLLAQLPAIVPLQGDLGKTVSAVLGHVWSLNPTFVILSVCAVAVAVWRRDGLGIGLVLLSWTFPFFSGLNIFGGQSAVFLRYFLLVIPTAFVLAVWLGAQFTRGRLLVQSVMLAASLLSAVSGTRAMQQAREWGQWNDVFIAALRSRTPADTWPEERALARFVAERVHGRDVLVDDFQGYRVIFFSGHPERFVATADDDFEETLRRPFGKVTYILAASPKLEGALNQVSRAYPGLYESGGDWVRLEREDGPWRLYRVTAPPAYTPANAASRLTPPDPRAQEPAR